MTRQHGKNKRAIVFWAAFLTILVGRVAGLLAFTSLGVQYFGAQVTTGGIPITNLLLHHVPLTQVSLITKQILVVGETGDTLPQLPIPYTQRLTTSSDFGPVAAREIRVIVEYRFVTSLDPLITAGVPVSTLPAIEWHGPTPFAFEVPRSSVVAERILQYRIKSQRIQYTNGQSTVLGQIMFPEATATDPDPFINVGVHVNAGEVIGAEGGSVSFIDANPEDGLTNVSIPAGGFSSPTLVNVNEIPLNSSLIPGGLSGGGSVGIQGRINNPVRIYRLASDTPVHGFTSATLTYPDFIYPQGKDGKDDVYGNPVESLTVYQWDGFTWRRMGGTINTQNNTITVRLSRLDYVAIAAGPPFAPEDRRPAEKIITPNSDGINDSATFALGDLTTQNIAVELFDINGHRVRTIYSQSTLEWNGRDDDGKIVESGVYIYQYEVDGKRISGFIAVAK